MSIYVHSVSWVVIVHCQGHARFCREIVAYWARNLSRTTLDSWQSCVVIAAKSCSTFNHSLSFLVKSVKLSYSQWDWQPTEKRRIRKRKNKPARRRKKKKNWFVISFLTRSKSTHIRDFHCVQNEERRNKIYQQWINKIYYEQSESINTVYENQHRYRYRKSRAEHAVKWNREP